MEPEVHYCVHNSMQLLVFIKPEYGMEKRTPKHCIIPTILCHVITLKSYKSMELVPVPSRTNAVHILPSYVFKINIDIVLHAMPMCKKWSHVFRFPHQNPESLSLTA
jgi:hypothetical protein